MTALDPQGQMPVQAPECPVCRRPIPLEAPVGGGGDVLLHIDCFLAERDAARIAAVIVERAVCMSCIATNTGVAPPMTVRAYVERIGRAVSTSSDIGPCAICGDVTHVVSIARP